MDSQMRLEIVSSCGGVTALCANKRLLSRAPFFNFAFYCLTFNKCLGPTFRTYQIHQALKFHPSHENQRVWMLVLFQNCMEEGTGGCKNHLVSLYLRVGGHVSLEDTSCCTGVVALFASKRLLSTVTVMCIFR